MRIDAHAHLKGDSTEMDMQICNLLSMYKILNIKKALLIPFDEMQKNEIIASIRDKFSDVFYFISLVDFENNMFENFEEQMTYHMEVLRCVGYKIHPRYQGISLTDNRLKSIVEIAGKLGQFVIIDCLPSRGLVRIADTLPLLVDDIAMSCPKTPIIMAHMGGHRVLDALIVAQKNPNVYMDISATIIKYQGSSIMQDIVYCLNKLSDMGKLIFGSDYPTFSPRDTYEILEGLIKQAHLSNVEIEKIMGSNFINIMEMSK